MFFKMAFGMSQTFAEMTAPGSQKDVGETMVSRNQGLRECWQLFQSTTSYSNDAYSAHAQ